MQLIALAVKNEENTRAKKHHPLTITTKICPIDPQHSPLTLKTLTPS